MSRRARFEAPAGLTNAGPGPGPHGFDERNGEVAIPEDERYFRAPGHHGLGAGLDQPPGRGSDDIAGTAFDGSGLDALFPENRRHDQFLILIGRCQNLQSGRFEDGMNDTRLQGSRRGQKSDCLDVGSDLPEFA
jgi:hypothetical protein